MPRPPMPLNEKLLDVSVETPDVEDPTHKDPTMTRDVPDQKPSPSSTMVMVCWRIIAAALLISFACLSYTAYLARKSDGSTSSEDGYAIIPGNHDDDIISIALIGTVVLFCFVCFIGILAEKTDCNSESMICGGFSSCFCCLCLSECPAPAIDACDESCHSCAVCTVECPDGDCC